MRLRVVIVVAALVGLLAACGGGGGGGGGPENVYIADENDNGQTVTMGVGDALQLSLPENRSTGYVWSVTTNDAAILRLDDEPAYVIEGEPLPGAGGRVTFSFTAVGPGTVTLQLVNARPSEAQEAVQPAQLFALTVTAGN